MSSYNDTIIQREATVNTRTLILTVAKEIFLEKGYKETTMREIAKRADVKLGVLPYHFTTKENIAKIIYDNMLSGYTEEIKNQLKDIENPISKLTYVYIHVMEKILETEGLIQFYHGLLEENMIATDPQEWTKSLVYEIARFYNDMTSLNQAEIICLIGKGVERALMQGKERGIIDISYVEINKIIIMAMISQMNITKSEAEKNIDLCIEMMKQNKIIKLTI